MKQASSRVEKTRRRVKKTRQRVKKQGEGLKRKDSQGWRNKVPADGSQAGFEG